MLELNRASTNDSGIDAYFNKSAVLSDQMAASASFASFNDVLANAQQDLMSAQNENSDLISASTSQSIASQSIASQSIASQSIASQSIASQNRNQASRSQSNSPASSNSQNAASNSALDRSQVTSDQQPQTQAQLHNQVPTSGRDQILNANQGATGSQALAKRQPPATQSQPAQNQLTDTQLTEPESTRNQPIQSQATQSQATQIQPTQIQPTQIQPTQIQATQIQPTQIQPNQTQATPTQANRNPLAAQNQTSNQVQDLTSGAATGIDQTSNTDKQLSLSVVTLVVTGAKPDSALQLQPSGLKSGEKKRLKDDLSVAGTALSGQNSTTATSLQTSFSSPAHDHANPQTQISQVTPNSPPFNLITQPGFSAVSQSVPRNGNSSSAGLAFAVKIKGKDATSLSNATKVTPTSAASADNDPADTGAANPSSAFSNELAGMLPLAVQKVRPDAGSSTVGAGASGLPTAVLPGSYQAATANIQNANGGPPEPAPEPIEDAASVDAMSADPEAATPQVKTVQVQITNSDDQRVDLRIVEKSGALTMSVRSADGALTKALQQNLPELATKLSEQQIRAEWWRPEVDPGSSSSQQDASQGGGSYKQDQSGQGQSQQGQTGQGKENSGQQGQRGSQPPSWLDELSAPRKSNQNGTQFTWQV